MNEYRCFHSRRPGEQDAAELNPGTIVEGVVACQHVFGIGVYVLDLDVWGHVNVTEMGIESVREDFANHPAIGSHLRLRVLGRSGSRQLRLAVT